MKFPGTPFPRIKPERHWPVKRAYFSLVLTGTLGFTFLSTFTYAANNDLGLGGAEISRPESLPDIEARTFDARTIRKSRNNRVILFEAAKEALPPVGRILLLKKSGIPQVAVRVLKTYADTDAFAAKIVRHYDSQSTIVPTDSFLAIEKISDLQPPPPTAQDQADLKELEKPMKPTAPEDPDKAFKDATGFGLEDLKAPTPQPSPAPTMEVLTPEPLPSPKEELQDLSGATAPAEKVTEKPPEKEPQAEPTVQAMPALEDEDDTLGQVLEDPPNYDPFRHWLSAGIGMLQNSGSYFSGGGARYGYTISKNPFNRISKIQDSLALEGGFFFYKVLNLSVQGDAYNVLPLVGTLRYNLYFGDSMSVFFYAGMVRNMATATSSLSTDVMAFRLSGLADDGSGFGIAPAFGGGMTFRVGPQWDLRLDLGYDVVGMGLMLRF